jgi:hypothetical protein
MWNFSTILVVYQLMQDEHVKLRQKQHSTDECYFHQQSGLTFKE